ncbi:MAG: hypothetical protein MJ175_01790 [Clostridia bacterium]|nr:hypothetical protein [Clostridia bacterium]
MTSTVSSVKTARTSGGWFSSRLFAAELKRGWAVGLLYAIILFFAYPVALMIASGNVHPESVAHYVEEFMNYSNPIPTIFATGAGIFSALTACGYLFNKRSVDYVFSLPVSRQAYFLTRGAAGVTCAMLAWIPSALILMVVSLASGRLRPLFGLIMGDYAKAAGVFLCLFFYFFSVTLCACAVCGTHVMSFCMFLFFSGILPLFYALFNWLFGEFRPHFYDSYYIRLSFFENLSGIVRIWSRVGRYLSFGFLLLNVGIGLVYLVIAILSVMFRRGENAESPFVYPKVRAVVKYFCMTAAALLGSLLFQAVAGGGYFWMLFGAVSFTILGWMLCNTVFFKTPKMMFHAKRGMLIALACVLIVLGLFPLDIFRMNTRIPSPSMTESVEIEDYCTLHNPDLIRLFDTVVKNAYADDYYDDKPYDGYSRYLYVIWHTRFGIPVAKSVRITSESDYKALMDAVRADADYPSMLVEQMRTPLEAVYRDDPHASVNLSVLYSTVPGFDYPDGNVQDYRSVSVKAALELLDIYEDAVRTNGASVLEKRSIGAILFYAYNGYGYDKALQITEPMQDVLEAALRKSESKWGNETVVVNPYDPSLLSGRFETIKLFCDGDYLRDVTEEELGRWMETGALTVVYGYTVDDYAMFDPHLSLEATVHHSYSDENDPSAVYDNYGYVRYVFFAGKAPDYDRAPER